MGSQSPKDSLAALVARRLWVHRSGAFRAFLIGGGGLFLLFSIAELFARQRVDADYLGNRVRELFGHPGLDIQIGHTELSLLRGRLYLRAVRISGPTGSGTVVDAAVPSVRLTGFRRLPFILEGDLEATGLDIAGPYLRITLGDPVQIPSDSLTSGADLRAPRDSGAAGAEAAAGRLTDDGDPHIVALESLRIRGGSLFIDREAAASATESGIGGLGIDELEMRGVDLHASDVRLGVQSLTLAREQLARSTRKLRIVSFAGMSDDGLASLGGRAFLLSVGDSTLALQDLSMSPELETTEYFDRLRFRKDRVDLRIGRLQSSGLDARGLLSGEDLAARVVVIDSLALSVASDKRLPPDPDADRQPLPNEIVRELDRGLAVDTVRVNGRITYSEIASGATRSGTVAFDSLTAQLVNLSNDSTRMTAATPLVVEARAHALGAPLETVFRIPLLSSRLDVSFQGGLDRTTLDRANEFLIPLAGLRIESGRLDTLWFDVSVRGDAATGVVNGIYRDLDLAIVDPDTGDGSVLDDIRSAFANLFAVESDNVPDEDGRLREGTVAHVIEVDDPFFERVWQSLRSGLESLVGL